MWDIFKYKELIEFDVLVVVDKVEFLRDFGPWKMYQKCDRLRIDFETLKMEEVTEGGTVLEWCRLKIEPI